MSIIHDLLMRAIGAGASDIHIKINQPPYFRVNGKLVESGYDVISPDDLAGIIRNIVPEFLQHRYEIEQEVDFSMNEENVGRFRVNVYTSQRFPVIAMRHVKAAIPTFEELRLPLQLKTLTRVHRGIILLVGVTGCGKSTTLAAIIGEINRTQQKRVITVEDPIEYQFYDDQSLITQREVGLDTHHFSSALKHLLRQDPDVVLIGEMRDPESIRTALLAAETGHLVLSTLHASTADSAIARILDVFPAEEQSNIRMALASNIHAIICQRLVPDLRGLMTPAVEIMFNTSTVKKLIERNQLEVLSAAIETGKDDGMQNFNQSMYQLIKQNLISETEGMAAATNPQALRMNLQGIFLDEGRRILSS